MRHHIRFRNLVGLVALGMFAACGPATTLEAGWTSRTAYTAPPMEKVVALFVSDNIAIRRSGEERLTRELAAKGVAASPAYAVLTDDDARALAMLGHDDKRAEPATAKVRALGYDGIVTMRIVDREQSVQYSPPAYPSWGYWGDPYWGYWDYNGGYAYTQTTYRLETSAYSLHSNQIVWSGLVRSVDPDSAHQLVGDASRVVAGQLTKNQLAG